MQLKGAQSYFSKFSFLLHLKNHHSKHVNLKFCLKWSSSLDVQSIFVYISYCVSVILVIITKHPFIHIFQITPQLKKKKKNSMGYQKSMSFSCDTKIYKSLKKKKKLKNLTGVSFCYNICISMQGWAFGNSAPSTKSTMWHDEHATAGHEGKIYKWD